MVIEHSGMHSFQVDEVAKTSANVHFFKSLEGVREERPTVKFLGMESVRFSATLSPHIWVTADMSVHWAT